MSMEFQLCAEELAKLQPPVGKTLKRRERRGSAEEAERGFHWQQVVKILRSYIAPSARAEELTKLQTVGKP
jgi:hypothetical protein